MLRVCVCVCVLCSTVVSYVRNEYGTVDPNEFNEQKKIIAAHRKEKQSHNLLKLKGSTTHNW